MDKSIAHEQTPDAVADCRMIQFQPKKPCYLPSVATGKNTKAMEELATRVQLL